MKKIILSLVALFVFSNVFSQGIEFENGTFSEALAKAKKENKIVFLDCYTSWCGPCQYLAKEVFTQKEVGDFFNKNFVNVKMDMESEAGKPLKERYQVSLYPTLLWLDGDGNVQHVNRGAGDANFLMAVATLALDKENNLSALDKRFKKGDRNSEFMRKYIMTSLRSGIDIKETADTYFSSKKLEELINSGDAEVIMHMVKRTSNPIYHFVLKNKSKFYAVADREQVNQFLEFAMRREMEPLLASEDSINAFNLKKKEFIALDKKVGTKAAAFMDIRILRRDPDQKKKSCQAMADYAIKYHFDKWKSLNYYASCIAEVKEDLGQELLNTAVKIAKRSVELKANFKNIDTYAFLLNKLGQKEEAKVQAEKSVELASEDQKKDLWAVKFLREEENETE